MFDNMSLTDVIVKLPVAGAVGDYLTDIINKAKLAGQPIDPGDPSLGKHPELTGVEQAVLISAVSGVMK